MKKIENESIEGEPHITINCGDEKIPMGEEVFVGVLHRNELYFSFLRLIESSSSLVVFLPAALPGVSSNYNRPAFSRWTWGRTLGVSTVAFDDPTLWKDALAGGWFQGSVADFGIDSVAEIVLWLASKCNVKNENIIFYGSSLGGYASLMLAAKIKGSTAISEIPQTKLEDYIYVNHIRNLCKSVYGSDDVKAISEKFPERFSVIEQFIANNYLPNCVLIHELTDEPNGSTQFYPFLSALASSSKKMGWALERVHVRVFNDGKGHKALEIERALPIIQQALQHNAYN